MSLQDDLKTQRGSVPMARRPRWDLVAAWAVLLGPAVALAAWGAARQSVGDLEERLVAESTEISGATHPRPVHVDAPVPGSVGDAVARHLPRIQAEAKASEKDEDGRGRLRAVVAGEAPLSTLPVRYSAALARLGPDLDGLLAGTRAERADLADPGDPSSWNDGGRWTALQVAGLLAGARVRLAIAAGEPGAGLDDCLDALALGRDASISGGLVGRIVGGAIVTRLAPPCAAALDAVSAERLPEALRRIRALRDAFPPITATFRDEAVRSQLFAGEILPADVRSRLLPRARAIAADGAKDPGWFERLVFRDGWRTQRAALAAIAAAADLPDPQRAAAFEHVKADLGRRIDVVTGVLLPLDAYLKYTRRMENARRRLDGLVVAAAARRFRLERGAWPRSIEDLSEAALVDGAEVARLEGRLSVQGRGIVLRAPLLGSYADDAQGLTLRVSAPSDVEPRSRPARSRAPGSR